MACTGIRQRHRGPIRHLPSIIISFFLSFSLPSLTVSSSDLIPCEYLSFYSSFYENVFHLVHLVSAKLTAVTQSYLVDPVTFTFVASQFYTQHLCLPTQCCLHPLTPISLWGRPLRLTCHWHVIVMRTLPHHPVRAVGVLRG